MAALFFAFASPTAQPFLYFSFRTYTDRQQHPHSPEINYLHTYLKQKETQITLEEIKPLHPLRFSFTHILVAQQSSFRIGHAWGLNLIFNQISLYVLSK